MSGPDQRVDADVLVVGAGAAGLATAIFATRARPGLRVVCLDGAKTVGAKILVSGGSRCNVTNRIVTERDFRGGTPRAIRAVLRAFSVPDTVAFFAELGVPLHEEAHGKLFPDSGRARTVLDALLAECARRGVTIRTHCRVEGIRHAADAFEVVTSDGPLSAPIVVLATGGCALPKSGSDGFGHQLARRLGHTVVVPVPALVPLVLGDAPHVALSGVSHEAEVCLRDGDQRVRCQGALLWTHFGASGPVILDASRHWLRAREDGRRATVTLNLLPGETPESLDQALVDAARAHPHGTLAGFFRTRLPAAVVEAFVTAAGLMPATPVSQVPRPARRALAALMTGGLLDVQGSRGFTQAETTAGGVRLEEVDPATMASRVCPGLYLVGEVLDVDGRLGGYNFQWAWSSGRVAGQAVARAMVSAPLPPSR